MRSECDSYYHILVILGFGVLIFMLIKGDDSFICNSGYIELIFYVLFK